MEAHPRLHVVPIFLFVPSVIELEALSFHYEGITKSQYFFKRNAILDLLL